MTNQETHRQFYLGAAGIRMWYAKRPLPGAAPSFEYELQDVAIPAESGLQDNAPVYSPPQAPAKPRENSPRQKSVDLQALMAPSKDVADEKTEALDPAMSAPPSQTEKVADSPVSDGSNLAEQDPAAERAQEETVKRPRVACHLGIWSTERYLLISQWSEEASERLQDSLAQNLLKALRQRQLEDRQMLHWPVFRNPHMPGNSSDDFRDVLARMVSARQERSIILLGVLIEEQDAHRKHCLSSVLPRVDVDFPHALAGLSTTPDYKRDLWNLLKSCYSV